MNRRYWTQEEDAIVLDAGLSDDAIANALGRSARAVRLRRWKLRADRVNPDWLQMTGRQPNTLEDVWRYVAKRGPDECWPWVGAQRRRGYGAFTLSRRQLVAHRAAFQSATGVDPGELSVCHTCDNPPCCNPAHLFLGTHTDNMRDMVAKGRDRWSRV